MHYNVVIIGSGFGGSMTGLTLAERTEGTNTKILMLERGTWWTTPVGTVQDKEVKMFDFLRNRGQPVQFWSSQNHFRGFLDLITRCFRRTRDSSLWTRWFRWLRNEDGLLETNWLGRRTIFGRTGDGILIARSCGVGGGSLVYSNITIRPPDFVLDGPRWPKGIWTDEQRHYYYNFARDAIGVGVVHALRVREINGDTQKFSGIVAHTARVEAKIEGFLEGQTLTVSQRDPAPPHDWTSITYPVTKAMTDPVRGDLRLGASLWLDLDPVASPPALRKVIPQGPFKVNTGLSNILTRTAHLSPYEKRVGKDEPFNPRGVIRLTVQKEPTPPSALPPDGNHSLWLDRARIFQTAMVNMTTDYGAVDLSINDLASDETPLVTNGRPKNYCERQGRCNVGCLPGARHTLNKQLVRAALGQAQHPELPQDFPDFKIQALCEVDVVRALPNGGYAVEFEQQSVENYRDQEGGKARRKVERKTITADVVIVSAGTVGTNEILLRSKHRETLPHLSDKTGFGFSPNGDYIAFMDPTRERVGLIKGPVTTSFGHFNTDQKGTGPDGPEAGPGEPAKFHTVEDQGIPPATASVLGEGLPLIRTLSKGNTGPFLILYSVWRYGLKLLRRAVRDIFRNAIRRGRLFVSEEELAANMMAVAVMGRDAANATFRLGTKSGETSLRVSKPEGKKFWEDPIYVEIRATLDRLAKKLGDPDAAFENPFLSRPLEAFKAQAIATSHPLGGCIMAESAATGTVNKFGQPFKVAPGDETSVYEGLYVADGSIVPSALGVNPSLTIAALSLHIADGIYRKHFAQGGGTTAAPPVQ